MTRLPRAGETFAGLELERELARGAMGVVFAARDPALERTVAVKVINPTWADDADYRRRFLREASALASAESPHIVHIHQFGEQGGVLFMSMQYVAGGDLAQAIMSGLSVDEVLAVGADLAGALADAHSVGVLHRDVKPRNVLLRPRANGFNAYLCDFGIAQLPTSTASLTGSITGTVLYMAPELFDGARPHPGVDLYALGCLLWECLTGRPPYTGSQAQIMYGHAQGPVPSLALSGIDQPALNDLLGLLLAKDPSTRPSDADQVQRELVDLRARRVVDGGEAPGRVTPPVVIGDEPPTLEAVTVRSGSPPGAAEALAAAEEGTVSDHVDANTVPRGTSVLGGADGTSVSQTSVGTVAQTVQASRARPSGPARRRGLVVALGAAALLLGLGAWALSDPGDRGDGTGTAGEDRSAGAESGTASSHGDRTSGTTTPEDTATDAVPQRGVAGDVDGDRRGDVVLMDKSVPAVRLLRVGLRAPTLAVGSRTPGDLAVQGDFDGDGRIDVASVSAERGLAVSSGRRGANPLGRPRVWLDRLPLTQSASLSAGDFTGDGRSDIAIVENGERSVVRVMAASGRQFGPARRWLTVPAAGGTRAIAGDFDGDGRSDVALLNDEDGALRFSVARSTGQRLGRPELWFSYRGWSLDDTRPVVGDFDGDGRADLGVLENIGPGSTLHVLRSTGSRFRDAATRPLESLYRRTVPVTSDVDGDGRVDVVLVTGGPQVTVLRSSRGGFRLGRTTSVRGDIGPFAVVGRGAYVSDD